MLCMVFGQITSKGRMRDLMLSLEAHSTKYYHLAWGRWSPAETLESQMKNVVLRSLKSLLTFWLKKPERTVIKTISRLVLMIMFVLWIPQWIDLCLSVFWRAEFRKWKGGVKLHTLYNEKTSIPSFLHINPASVYDVNILGIIPYETGSFYFVDKDISISNDCTNCT